jgi:hypothetical protein
LNLSARLINHGTLFFSHNKTASVGLSAAKTISRTAVTQGLYVTKKLSNHNAPYKKKWRE